MLHSGLPFNKAVRFEPIVRYAAPSPIRDGHNARSAVQEGVALNRVSSNHRFAEFLDRYTLRTGGLSNRVTGLYSNIRFFLYSVSINDCKLESSSLDHRQTADTVIFPKNNSSGSHDVASALEIAQFLSRSGKRIFFHRNSFGI